MQYVKVVAPSHAEALKKLRDTYGPEAIIFGESEVAAKSFVAKAMGKRQFMIEAAIREKKSPTKDMKNKFEDLEKLLNKPTSPLKETTQRLESELNFEKVVKDKIQREVQPNTGFEKEKKAFFDTLKRAELVHADEPKEKNKAPVKDLEDYASFAALQSDIAFIKEQLLDNTNIANKPKEIEFAQMYDLLRSQDFSDQFASSFVNKLKTMIPQNEWKLKKRIYVKARELLMGSIMTNANLGSKRAVALLGPTGVGKTTTVAKLAAWLKLKEKMAVSLITLDNFRIAATEQLKVFGDIMDIPVHICRNADEFKDKIMKDSADIILVDTTGLSQKKPSNAHKCSRILCRL